MRIVFMGTPEFSIPALERLAGGAGEVVAVYTQRDHPAGRGRTPTPPPLKRAASEHGLTVYQPRSLRAPAEQELLESLKPDVIVVAAYGQMLPPEVLSIPEFGCLNIHPSLLPKYRGPAPISSAILAGDEVTGVTIMLLDFGMDTGPTLAQTSVPIEQSDTAESLGSRLARIGADLLVETLPRWLHGDVAPRQQGEEGVTYTRALSKRDGEIDWGLPAAEIERRIRAFYPWPGCHTHWNGKMLKILEASDVLPDGGVVEGEVVALPSGAGVGTGRGALALHKVQLEGKRAVAIDEFLRGQRGFIGQHLGR